MKKTVLNFTGCRYMHQMHKIIREAFDFPDYYGDNYSALWDCMRDLCNDTEAEIHGLHSLPEEFDDFREKLLNIFERVAEEINFKYAVIS